MNRLYSIADSLSSVLLQVTKVITHPKISATNRNARHSPLLSSRLTFQMTYVATAPSIESNMIAAIFGLVNPTPNMYMAENPAPSTKKTAKTHSCSIPLPSINGTVLSD
ncbi:MAG: hypothetical protein J1F68_04805 [Clostridiales bacterium]|nr:hypothetical protein [Clostridiales bacterium]